MELQAANWILFVPGFATRFGPRAGPIGIGFTAGIAKSAFERVNLCFLASVQVALLRRFEIYDIIAHGSDSPVLILDWLAAPGHPYAVPTRLSTPWPEAGPEFHRHRYFHISLARR